MTTPPPDQPAWVAPSGRPVYHLFNWCSTLRHQSDGLTETTVAVAESDGLGLCVNCEHRIGKGLPTRVPEETE